MRKLVCIKTYLNRAEAEIAKQLLEKDNIKVMISADDAGGVRPELLMGTGGVKLLVWEKDKEKALSLLKETTS